MARRSTEREMPHGERSVSQSTSIGSGNFRMLREGASRNL